MALAVIYDGNKRQEKRLIKNKRQSSSEYIKMASNAPINAIATPNIFSSRFAADTKPHTMKIQDGLRPVWLATLATHKLIVQTAPVYRWLALN